MLAIQPHTLSEYLCKWVKTEVGRDLIWNAVKLCPAEVAHWLADVCILAHPR